MNHILIFKTHVAVRLAHRTSPPADGNPVSADARRSMRHFIHGKILYLLVKRNKPFVIRTASICFKVHSHSVFYFTTHRIKTHLLVISYKSNVKFIYNLDFTPIKYLFLHAKIKWYEMRPVALHVSPFPRFHVLCWVIYDYD